METIQLQISAEMAQRLRSHYDELPQILEWGLRRVERKSQSLLSSTPPLKKQRREEVLAALKATGIVVVLDPELAARYLVDVAQESSLPVAVPGKPLSEMIIEERDRQWGKSE